MNEKYKWEAPKLSAKLQEIKSVFGKLLLFPGGK